MRTIPPPTSSSIRIVSLLVIAMVGACIQEEPIQVTKLVPDFVDETLIKSEADRQNMEAILTTTRVLRKIYKDRNVIEEVNAAIASGYYVDERVLLKDLLNPETSPIYQLPQFKERQVKLGFKIGSFKANFKKELGFVDGDEFRTKELFFDEGGVSIYFPYHEDTESTPYIYAVAPASVDANQQVIPMPYGPDPDIINPPDHVMLVDDNYASVYPTHVVGMGATLSNQTSNQNCSGSIKINVGHVKIYYEQYDRLFNPSWENGGGSEIDILTTSGGGANYNQTGIDRYVRVPVGRREIRNAYWVASQEDLVYTWLPQDINRLFAIYEYDQGDTKIISGNSLLTSVNGFTYSWTYELTMSTKETIIHNKKYGRDYMIQLQNTYGSTSQYLTGFGPQFRSDDNNVDFSLPIGCL
jgi:hypothetical protein